MKLAILAAFPAAMLALASPTAAQTTATWSLAGNGTWSTPANWSTNPVAPINGQPLPGDTYNAVLDTARTITVDVPVAIQGFTMSTGTLTGANTLTINGLTNFSGGTISGAGIIHAIGGMSLGGGTKTITGTGRQVNHGDGVTPSLATLTGGVLSIQGVAEFSNKAAATIDISVDGTVIDNIQGSPSTFNNAGIITKSAGSGTSTIQGNLTFNNTGTVNVESGTLALSMSPATHTDSAFNVASGTTLRFGGTTHTISGTTALSALGTGSVQFSAGTCHFNTGSYTVAGSTTVNGGTANFNIPATTNALVLSSGTLGGTGILTVNGLTTWSGGTMGVFSASGGVTDCLGGMTLEGGSKLIRSSRQVNHGNGVNPSASTWTAGILDIGGGGAFNNKANATLDVSFDGTIIDNTQGTFSSFNNSGVLTKSAGSGVSKIQGNIGFNNAGSVNVNSGTLELAVPGTQSGAFNLAGGTFLNLSGGNQTWNAGTIFTGSGTTSVTGGLTIAVAGDVSVAGPFVLDHTSATINGAGILTVNGLMTWTGGAINTSGTTRANGGMNFSGPGAKNISASRTVSLGGNSTWTGGTINVGGAAVLKNEAGRVFETNFDGTIANPFGGLDTFQNEGTFTKSAGTGTSTIGIKLNNTGTVNVNAGTLLFSVAPTQHSGSTLNGGTWNVRNGSTLAFSSGSNITTNGPDSSVTLDGSGSTFARFTAALNNNQGSLTLKNDRDLSTAGALANSGTLRVEDAATLLSVSGVFTQTAGSTTLVGGAQISASAGFELGSGTLAGTGTLNGNLLSSNSLVISPGASAGTLTINGNAILSFSNTLLAMEIGGMAPGTGHDQLLLNGILSLGGSLSLSLIEGFIPSFGENITLVDTGFLINGTFFNVANGGRLDVAGGEYSFKVNYGANSAFVDDTDKVVLSDFSDTIAPVLTLPDNIVMEATAPMTPVNFTVSANDAIQGSITPVVTPPSGSGFPVGVSTVNVSATDVGDNTANGSFTVTIVDTTPPSLVVPSSPVEFFTTSLAGRTVDLTGLLSATDLASSPVITTNPPSGPSGSVFPLGTTTVTVTATDDEGLQTTDTFDVVVTGQPDIGVEESNVGNELDDGEALPAFANTKLGTSSLARSVTIRNDGANTLEIGQITVGGDHPEDFVVSGPVENILAGPYATTFTVTFSPTTTAGPRSAVLHIASNDPNVAEATFDIPVSGLAIDEPDVLTGSATSVTYGSATLNGSVTANFLDATVTFEYGTSTDYGQSIAATPSPVSGGNASAVSASLFGLLDADTTYHFRVRAENDAGISFGGDATFTTPPAPPGSIDLGFNPSINGQVFSTVVQPDGKILVLGAFSQVNGVARDQLARLHPNGSLDTTFNPSPGVIDTGLDGSASCMALQSDGKVLVGGYFTTEFGAPRNHIVRLNPDGSHDTTFNVITEGSIRSIQLDRLGKILIGGQFISVNNTSARTAVARLHPNGSVDTSYNPLATNIVQGDIGFSSMTLQGDNLVVCASSVGNGSTEAGIVRFDATGADDPSFATLLAAPSFGEPFGHMATIQPDGKLVLTGYFETVNGQPREWITRLNTNGTLDGGFSSGGMDDYARSSTVQADGNVLIAGAFTQVGGAPSPAIARLLAGNGAVDPAFAPGSDSFTLSSVALQRDGKILIGGEISMVQGFPRQNLVRLLNSPATESLAVTASNRVQWLRGGTTPDSQVVFFESSVDEGATWQSLGLGTRIAGGWEYVGTLPSGGIIRANARTTSGLSSGSSGLIQAQVAYGNPTISEIAGLSTYEGIPLGPIPFSVSDPESLAGNLTVTASSSVQIILPDENILIGGSGEDRTVTLSPLPGISGDVTVTLTVSDGVNTASTSFLFQVISLNFFWNTGSGNWSVANQWGDGFAPPVNLSNTKLTFLSSPVGYTATNDIGPLQLNQLVSSGSDTGLIVLAASDPANAVTFAGTDPLIHTPTNTQLRATVPFTGNATIRKTGGGTFEQRSDSSGFTGSLVVDEGTFAITATSTGTFNFNAESITVNALGTLRFGNNGIGNPNIPNTTYITLNLDGKAEWEESEDFGGFHLHGGLMSLEGGRPRPRGTTPMSWTSGIIASGEAMVIDPTNDIHKTSTGTVSLEGEVSLGGTGTLHIEQGKIQHTTAASLGTSAVVLGTETTEGVFSFFSLLPLTGTRGGSFTVREGGGVFEVASAAHLTLNASTTITGPGTLRKTDGGTLTLEGTATNSGGITLVGGRIDGTGTISGQLLAGQDTIIESIDTESLTVGSCVLEGTLEVTRSDLPASPFKVLGELDITQGQLQLFLLPGAGDIHIVAEYGSLTGSAFQAAFLPSGYRVIYNYLGRNQIAVVPNATGYAGWAVENGIALAGGVPVAGPEVDSDDDGVPNGIEFVVGGVNFGENRNSQGLLPTFFRDGNHIVFEFRQSAASSESDVRVEYSSHLASWTQAVEGQPALNPVFTSTTNDFYGPGVDRVRFLIPLVLFPDDKNVFLRLVLEP